VCKYKMQLSLKRCKQYVLSPIVISLLIFSSFELGGEKKTKGAALTFVRQVGLYDSHHLLNYLSVSLYYSFMHFPSSLSYCKYDSHARFRDVVLQCHPLRHCNVAIRPGLSLRCDDRA